MYILFILSKISKRFNFLFVFTAFVPNEDAIDSITGMGFTRPQAIKALKETNNNVERAVDYIFSHAGELDSEPMDTGASPQQSSQGINSTSETYRDAGGSKS